MYQSEVNADLRRRRADAQGRGAGIRSVPANVWFLGLTSLLTDLSSEMVSSVLPIYAMYFLHLSPAAFGVIDGLQQGGASLVKLLSGFVTDRTRRYKTLAGAGYVASGLSRLGLVLAGPSQGWLTPLVALDRIGKGVRTAPRDALISLSVERDSLASAFGVHRTLDTVGALLGPLLGLLILQRIRDGYDVIFVVSVALAAIGVAVLVTFVRTPVAVSAESGMAPAAGIMTPAVVRIAISAAILGLATVSDAFIYLTLQRNLGFNAEYLPILYIATPAVYLTLATPFGAIADRLGTARVIMLGYGAMLAIYFTLASSWPATVVGIATVTLLGMFYAATDGVFAALVSRQLPVERRATGLAIVSTVNDVGRLVASIGFGWLWSVRGPTSSAIEPFQIILIAAMISVSVLLWPILRQPTA